MVADPAQQAASASEAASEPQRKECSSVATDPKDPVVSIMNRVSNDKLGLVQAGDLLEKAFKNLGLLYEMDIHCRMVGFDPSNRDNTGGNTQEVFLLMSDIAMVGWSWNEVQHALCVEVIPGDPTVEDFNRMLVASTPLAPVEAGTIHFGSLSCGHTNYGLRCLDAGVALNYQGAP